MGGWQREAESPIKVLKTTIVGGLLFLLPLVLVVLLLSHALRFAGKAVGPISEFLTLDKVFGPAAEESLAVLILVFISLAAGLIARTRFGRDIMRRTGNSFLGGLPQYRPVKSVAEGFAQIENAENLKPVLVKYRGRVADRIFAGITSDRLGCRLRPPGTDTHVGQCNVSARRTRAASGHLNGGDHVTRKAHGDRFFEGSCHRGSRASQDCLDQVDIRSRFPVAALRFS